MKKLLIVSLYYPPVKSVASNRIGSFTKYLDKRFYEIDVITVRPSTLSKIEESMNVTVHRVAKNPFDSYLKITQDTHYLIRKLKAVYNRMTKVFLSFLWKMKAQQKAFELYKIKQYDIILSSYAPESTHQIALALKKTYPQIRWIADMRDEMSLNPFLPEAEKRKLQKLEQEIFTYCDALTTVSKPILEDFTRLAGEKANKIVFGEIRNGYDFEINHTYQKNKVFTIRYLGSFYGDRNARNFLKALGELVKEKKIERIQVQFIGNVGVMKISKKLEPFISIKEAVDHKEALKLMSESDVLMIIHPNNGRKGIYTGKLFEYLAMNKPILAVIDPSDVAADLIKKCNAGYIADSENIGQIKEAILLTYTQWKNNKVHEVNCDIVKQHHRKEQAKRLQLLIEELT